MMMDKDNINNKNNDLNNSLIQKLTAIQTKQVGKIRKIPPLQSWQPRRTTPLDIEIRDNGEWWHEGQKMTRQSLVDLFASVLWVEWHDDQAIHYLKPQLTSIKFMWLTHHCLSIKSLKSRMLMVSG